MCSDWSDRLSIKLFANGQLSRVFMTKCGLGTESSRWVTELFLARVVCNPWWRILYIESRSVNTLTTKRQTIKSCSLNSTAICRRVKSCSVNWLKCVFLIAVKYSFNLVVLTFNVGILMLDCNVLMLSVLTIKGTAVIKSERKAARH